MVNTQAAHEVHESHGNSVAAWTSVIVIMLGALVSCWGVAVGSMTLSIAGGVVVVVGAILGKVMSAMGYGVAGHR
ncbi:MAG: hypothetical protein IPJ14_20615 [Kineosporiaceae bacterium]|nr:hypothetical protein [Kineosporiaceae bacterium]MBK7624993.1 hypothetical protein [Kineosporiaceae bacterium]MBK8076627.1 hypothetical protein [Kineosporiaceae bacterium]